MKETKHTGGMMEFSYPKGYKPKWNEADDMRRKSIKEYYEKEAIKKEQKDKMKNIVMILVVVIIIFLVLLKILKIV